MRTFSAETTQLEKLNALLRKIWEGNAFYARRWRDAGVRAGPLSSLDDLPSFPLLRRDDVLSDQRKAPPLGTNITGPARDLKRFHRSSGTTRAPVVWADSAESWDWVARCSHQLWRLAGVHSTDRVLMLMPFAASSGPWIIHEGACRLGCGCLRASLEDPGEPIRWLGTLRPTVLAGKPSVLHSLALRAEADGTPASQFGVRKLILTGENAWDRRGLYEKEWGAECFDRYGLTEAGSVAGECAAHSGGLHLLDEEFIAEVIDPDSGRPLPDGVPGELVLTNLGRTACPVVRYATGDIVRLARGRECACGLAGTMLMDGIRRRGMR